MANHPPLNIHQKFTIGVFVVIGLVTAVLGAINLRKSVAAPFVRKQSSFVFKTADELERERLEKLKREDTDGDGINDYDELHVFRTSPYLEDSDSDGITDGTEINQNSDPNCPVGKNCRGRATASAESVPGPAWQPQAASVGTPIVQDDTAILAAVTEAFGDLNALTPEMLAEKIGTMPAPDLQSFLLKIGLPKELLDKSDDATLRSLVLETFNESMSAARKASRRTTISGSADETK